MILVKLQLVEIIIEEQEVTLVQIIITKDPIMVEVKDVEHLHSIINMELILVFVSHKNTFFFLN
jgi:hypothetical protein